MGKAYGIALDILVEGDTSEAKKNPAANTQSLLRAAPVGAVLGDSLRSASLAQLTHIAPARESSGTRIRLFGRAQRQRLENVRRNIKCLV